MWDLFFCDSYELKVVRKWEIWKKGKFRLFFHSGLFSVCPLAILFLASVVVSDLKSKESEETNRAGSLWYLSELSSWVKDRIKNKKTKHSALCVFLSSVQSKCASACFFFSSFSTLEVLRVSTALPSLSSFPSEIFGQLWLNVCITEVVTLTSCLIPGPSRLNWWPE